MLTFRAGVQSVSVEHRQLGTVWHRCTGTYVTVGRVGNTVSKVQVWDGTCVTVGRVGNTVSEVQVWDGTGGAVGQCWQHCQ